MRFLKGDLISAGGNGYFIALRDIPNEQYIMTFGRLETLLIQRDEFKKIGNWDEARSAFNKENPIISSWSEGENMNERRKNNALSFNDFLKEKYGIRDVNKITPFC